jgi:hypothetical protein
MLTSVSSGGIGAPSSGGAEVVVGEVVVVGALRVSNGSAPVDSTPAFGVHATSRRPPTATAAEQREEEARRRIGSDYAPTTGTRCQPGIARQHRAEMMTM